jgi:TIR domain-containing protein
LRVFLSYASEDRPIAERVSLALQGAGHEVFFDRTSLPPGETFELQILDAIERADLMVFLLGPEAVAPGAYALTELGIARRRWPNPARRVIPVMVRRVDIDAVPAYLRAITILEPEGDLVAEVVSAVDRLGAHGLRRFRRALPWGVTGIALAGVGYALTVVVPARIGRSECGLAVTEARTIAERMREFAPPAAVRENELREGQHDERLSGTEHAAKSREWSELVEADNQRMEALLADAQRVRDGLAARCRLSGAPQGNWGMPAERVYPPRLGRLIEVADELDRLVSLARAD